MVLCGLFIDLFRVVGLFNPRQFGAIFVVWLLSDSFRRLYFAFCYRYIFFVPKRALDNIVLNRMNFCSLIAFFYLKLHSSFIDSLLWIINVGVFVVSWINLITIKSSIFSILVVTHLNKIFLRSDVLLTNVPIGYLWLAGNLVISLFPAFPRVWSAIGNRIKAFWWILNAISFLIVSCCIILPVWGLIIKEIMTRISLCSDREFFNSHCRWLWFKYSARLRKTPTSLVTFLLD